MPRAGLDPAAVVAAGAALADEIGFAELTMGRLAERLGVRTPSLYKHVASQDDLNRRIAALALIEAAARDRGRHPGPRRPGRARRRRPRAPRLRPAPPRPVRGHHRPRADRPGRPDGRRGGAGDRAVHRGAAVLRHRPGGHDHALRALRSAFHGFATLQSGGGFQWSTDIDESFEWLIDLVDRGLRALSAPSTAGR